MRAGLFALLFCAIPASADGATTPFCAAIAGLKAEALRSANAQHVGIVKAEPMTFACELKRGVAAQEAFCAAAMEAVGIEFTHAFPWKVYDCLRRYGLRPNVATVDQYTGINRKKVIRLWAGWRDGTRLDIQFQPTGDFSDEPRFKGYWGIYSMVVWHP